MKKHTIIRLRQSIVLSTSTVLYVVGYTAQYTSVAYFSNHSQVSYQPLLQTQANQELAN